jgi:NAD(P)-dependent dehydrogenase (short-subunit alcohol dehydrogenase family)
MGLLSEETVVITGAGNGIGRATALLFAQEGAHVVVNDCGVARDGSGTNRGPADEVVGLIRENGGTAVPNYDDVATESGARGLCAQAVNEFGGLDVFVNNAGIIRDKTLLKLTLENWDEVLRVHLTGAFLCTQAAALQMKQQGRGGRIVHTTSISGMLGNFGQANYAAAKAGVYGLMRTASIELQRYDIFVNAVAPLAKTRLTEDLPMFEKIDDSMTPAHVAPAHLFFASHLSGKRTGHVLSVTGGKMSLYKVVETAGRFKEAENGVWTADEIAEHFDSLQKL